MSNFTPDVLKSLKGKLGEKNLGLKETTSSEKLKPGAGGRPRSRTAPDVRVVPKLDFGKQEVTQQRSLPRLEKKHSEGSNKEKETDKEVLGRRSRGNSDTSLNLPKEKREGIERRSSLVALEMLGRVVSESKRAHTIPMINHPTGREGVDSSERPTLTKEVLRKKESEELNTEEKLEIAYACIKTNDAEAGMKILREIDSDDPRYEEGLLLMGVLYRKKGEMQLALKCFAQIEKDHGEIFNEACNEKILIYTSEGDTKKALQSFHSISDKSAIYPYAVNNLANYVLGNEETGRKDVKATVRLLEKLNTNPESEVGIQTLYHLAAGYLELKEYEEAIKYMKLFPKNHPAYHAVCFGKGRAYLHLGWRAYIKAAGKDFVNKIEDIDESIEKVEKHFKEAYDRKKSYVKKTKRKSSDPKINVARSLIRKGTSCFIGVQDGSMSPRTKSESEYTEVQLRRLSSQKEIAKELKGPHYIEQALKNIELAGMSFCEALGATTEKEQLKKMKRHFKDEMAIFSDRIEHYEKKAKEEEKEKLKTPRLHNTGSRERGKTL